jgi:hypothetical protein
MSRKQDDRVGRSRGPTVWVRDSEAGCCAPVNVVSIPSAGRSRFAGPSSHAPWRSRMAGMRPSARAGGSLRGNGIPTGLLLARNAAGYRNRNRGERMNCNEVAV